MLQLKKNKYKLRFLQKFLICDDFSKKCHVIFKKLFFIFEKFLTCLVCASNFKSINSSSLSRKNYNGSNFALTLRQLLQGQNMLVGIRLIDLTEPHDTLNYKPFFKYCILQTILHVFLFFVFMLFL